MARLITLPHLAAALLVVVFAGCQGTPKKEQHAGTTETPAPASTDAQPQPATSDAPTERTRYNAKYDEEIKEILDLARRDRWEEADRRAAALYERDPQDGAVQRVRSWVVRQRELHQGQALEADIREIDSNNSAFNPTLPDLLKEEKDRGLPARKDVRDAVDQITSTPYVPPSYGRTNYVKGPLFDFASEQGRMQKILDQPISVHLDNVTLESIIFNVGQANGINFVADKSLPAFKQTLSVNLDKVRLREFLNYVSRNLDLQFQVGDDLIWVVDAKDPKKVQEETRFYRLRKGFVLPAEFGSDEATRNVSRNPQNPGQITGITEVSKLNRFVNDMAPEMPALETAITNFFNGTKYFIDYERNLIVAKGTREQLETLEKIIKEFDRPIQQVLIEARFITVSQPAFMQLGVLWETGRQIAPGRTPLDFTSLVGSESLSRVGLGLQETFTNVLARASLSATISALEQSGESQTLSAPRLTVLNNRPAKISDGKVQYYYEEYTVKTTITERTSASSWVPQGKPTKLQAGVELDVLASISGDGQSILLALNPKVSQDVKLVTFATLSDTDAEGNVTSSFDIKLPESRTQELATRVAVRSGETVVMGGVLEREQTTFVESVPVLGNIPIIGPLFRRRTEIDRPRYLLIFVTATIVSETGEFIVFENQGR